MNEFYLTGGNISPYVLRAKTWPIDLHVNATYLCNNGDEIRSLGWSNRRREHWWSIV